MLSILGSRFHHLQPAVSKFSKSKLWIPKSTIHISPYLLSSGHLFIRCARCIYLCHQELFSGSIRGQLIRIPAGIVDLMTFFELELWDSSGEVSAQREVSTCRPVCFSRDREKVTLCEDNATWADTLQIATVCLLSPQIAGSHSKRSWHLAGHYL